MRLKNLTFASTLALCVGISGFGSAMAQASSRTIETERAGTVTVDRDVERTDSGATGSTVLSVGDRAVERSYDRTFDSETGTWSTERAATTANGRNATSTASVTCNGDGVCTRTGGYTGPRGASGGSETTAIRSGDGDFTAHTIATRPDGTGVSRDRFSSGTPGARDGEIVTTGPRGETSRRFERRYERGDGFATSRDVTGPEGRLRAVDRRVERTGRSEYVRDRAVTDVGGETRESRRWVRVDRDRRED
ncbi:MAG: hypothetical protein GC196_14980 [Hyphomonas sp.]|nr:hypothetical protein [Hyphomonas sp.]